MSMTCSAAMLTLALSSSLPPHRPCFLAMCRRMAFVWVSFTWDRVPGVPSHPHLSVYVVGKVGEVQAQGELDPEPGGQVPGRRRPGDRVFGVLEVSAGVGEQEPDGLGEAPDVPVTQLWLGTHYGREIAGWLVGFLSLTVWLVGWLAGF